LTYQRTGEYKDKFRDSNSNNIRHLFSKTARIQTILWESGLRAARKGLLIGKGSSGVQQKKVIN
jgi:hypothetical protein